MKTSKQIRQEYISFFTERGHSFVRSAPVVPHDDPTLLFTNSGMAQFKDIFLGTGSRDYNRAVNSQKCIRASGKHNDLEDVGHDNYHHTFFEMLGNWSFGDYFKQQAIVWAWELITGVWGLPKEKLWATVFEGGDGVDPDEEAEQFWWKETDIQKNQVLRYDKSDNFWEMGEVGPCGPCSELHIDLGEGTCPLSDQHECAVNVEGCWRFVELWNLVFMQYQRFPDQHLEPLPAQHVDTGMGLERICRVLQQVDSNYSTDLFVPILGKISEVTGTEDKEGEIGVAYRVIADHLRSLSFAIADGAIPSNEGRGYVLRRMLRRATRFGRVLGMEKPFIHQLVGTLSEVMGEAFPELPAQQKHIEKVIESEESSFGQTLDRGLEIFEQMASSSGTSERGGLSGEDAFKLYDTYGFPVDLTRLMCDERGLSVDETGFEKLMEEQRTRAREAGKFKMTLDDWTEFKEGESEFVGYFQFEAESEVLRYSSSGNDEWQIVLEQTPFYAESGGQVADQGSLLQDGKTWQVSDVQKQGGSIVHYCKGTDKPESGKIKAVVDASKRLQATNNHSATHLMLAAMREILGTHVTQAGSIVHPEYLRFDFTHPEKPTQEEMDQIESRVNDKIRENIPTEIYQTEYQKAIDSGIVAMFGEKYGDVVRVIKLGDFSEELCGGCHVQSTGQIGHFRLVSEEGIASGIRRFVGVTGIQAESISRQENRVAQNLRQLLNVPVEKVTETVEKLLDEKRGLEKEIQEMRKQNAGANAGSLLEEAELVGDVHVIARQVEVQSMDEFRSMADSLRKQLNNGVAWLSAEIDGKSSLLCVVSDPLLERGLKAGELVNAVASLAEGKGGGKPHMAQAGIKAPQLLPQALNQAPDLLRQKLGI